MTGLEWRTHSPEEVQAILARNNNSWRKQADKAFFIGMLAGVTITLIIVGVGVWI